MPSTFQKIFPRLLLSLFYGAYLFLALVAFFMKGGISEREEWLIFIVGWTVVPLLTLGLVLLVGRIDEQWLSSHPAFMPVLCLLNGLFMLIATGIVRFYSSAARFCGDQDPFDCVINALEAQVPDWQLSRSVNFNVDQNILWTLLILFPLMNVGTAFAVRMLKPRTGPGYVRFYGLIPVLLGLTALYFSGLKFHDLAWMPVLFAVSVALVRLCEAGRGRLEEVSGRFRIKGRAVLASLVVVVIFAAVFDPAFSVNRPHQFPYLEAVCDMRAGKTLLVDINTQYGVWVEYFLWGLFHVVPFSNEGLTLINILLTAGYYSLIFVLLRFLLNSSLFSAATTLAVLLVNFFATLGGEIVAFPSLGPLRFGLPYVFLLWTMMRFSAPRSQRTNMSLRWLERLTVALSSLWSFETFVYTLGVSLAVNIYERIARFEGAAPGIKDLSAELGRTFFVTAIAHGLFALSVFIRSGQWPHWNYYFDYIFLYSVGGWGAMPVPPWSPWVFIVVVPFLGLMGLLLQARHRSPASRPDKGAPCLGHGKSVLVAGLSALAVLEFTYFVGRSHVNNLFHVSVPALALAACGMLALCKSRRSDPPGEIFCRTARPVCGTFFLCLVLFLSPSMLRKVRLRLPEYARIHENFRRGPTTPQVEEALSLIKKYASNQKRIALFIDLDDTTETLIRSRKAHVYPFNYPKMAEIAPPVMERVFNFEPDFQQGDILFVARDINDFRTRIIMDIRKKYHFIIREESAHGIMAIELKKI